MNSINWGFGQKNVRKVKVGLTVVISVCWLSRFFGVPLNSSLCRRRFLWSQELKLANELRLSILVELQDFLSVHCDQLHLFLHFVPTAPIYVGILEDINNYSPNFYFIKIIYLSLLHLQEEKQNLRNGLDSKDGWI